MDRRQIIWALLNNDIVPHLLSLLRIHIPQRKHGSEGGLDLYCLRIIAQLAIHGPANNLNGTYTHSAFAALLRRDLFGDSDFLTQACRILLAAWITNIEYARLLLSPVQGPSYNLFHPCPKKAQDESAGSYADRMHAYLGCLNREIQSLRFEDKMEIGWSIPFRNYVKTSLSSLLIQFNDIQPTATWRISRELDRIRTKIDVFLMELDEAQELDMDGNTLLHLLSQQEDESMVVSEMQELFMNWTTQSQEMLNYPNRWSQTPLYMAARAGHLLIVQFLVQHGAQLNCSTEDGDSPLAASIRSKNFALVQYLLQEGAVVDPLQRTGDTPLHIAALSGDSAIVSYLLYRGEDFNRQNNFGDTPLTLALDAESSDIVQMFLACWDDNDDL